MTTYTSHVNNFFNAQNVTTCILVLTPQGPTQHLQVLMGRLIQVSHWESTVPPTELRVSDTGQLGPSNSSGVLNRLYSHPTSVTPTSSNSSVTGLTCSGDTNQEFIIKQGVPILVAWPISGIPLHHEEFLCKLQSCSFDHGSPKPTAVTTHCFQKWASWCDQRNRDPTVVP